MSGSENAAPSKEIPEYFLVSPPTLKELSSREVVAMTFRYRMKTSSSNSIICTSFNMDLFLKIEDLLGVDKKFLKKIIQSDVIKPVCISIHEWIKHHWNVFFKSIDRERVNLYCLDELVLRPDGAVCYLNTAKNLLNSEKLDIFDKYVLACVNCLADQIGKIWPFVSSDPRINRSNAPLITYWNSVMKGESEEQCRNILRSKRSDILSSGRWPAVEYVFNTLAEDELVSVAEYVIKMDPEYFSECVLLKMNINSGRLKELIGKIDLGEVGKVDENKLSAAVFLKIWNFKKYFIAEEDFFFIMQDLIRARKNLNHKYLFSILFEMWNSAPIHLKKSVLSEKEDLEWIFRKLNSYHLYRYNCYEFKLSAISISNLAKSPYSADMRFFIAVLTDLPSHSRNSIWRNSWTDIIIACNPIFLDEIMKLSFSNDEEITQFKEREMANFYNIEKFCLLLIKRKFVSDLMDYLHFCFTDNKKVGDLAREIITSSSVKSFFRIHFDERGLKVFDKLIDTAFEDPKDRIAYITSIAIPHSG